MANEYLHDLTNFFAVHWSVFGITISLVLMVIALRLWTTHQLGKNALVGFFLALALLLETLVNSHFLIRRFLMNSGYEDSATWTTTHPDRPEWFVYGMLLTTMGVSFSLLGAIYCLGSNSRLWRNSVRVFLAGTVAVSAWVLVRVG